MTVVLSESMCCTLNATEEALYDIFGRHFWPWPRTKIVLKDITLDVVEEKPEEAERTIRAKGRFWVNRGNTYQERGVHLIHAYFRLRKNGERGRGFDIIRSNHFSHALKVDDKLYIASWDGHRVGILASWNPRTVHERLNSTLSWLAQA